MSRGMVIIGAGECGARAALTLRDLGYAGPVTLVGQESHLPYERPPLSKEAMIAEAEPEPRFIADAARFRDQGIACLVSTAAISIDRLKKSVTLADGAVLPYGKLLLATGAKPRQLTLPGADDRRSHYLRNFDDAVRLRRDINPGSRVTIIGGGFIGLELAASARKRGGTVTVVEVQPRILIRGVPEEISEIVAERHRTEDVRLICGKGLSAFLPSRSGIDVILSDGLSISSDIVIIGIGSQPTTSLAEAAGLVIDNGIVADAQLRTSAPDIFAAGDCCSFPLEILDGRRVRLESWRNAQEQGALAARNMLGANESHAAVPWFWSDQYDLTLQVAGLPNAGSRTVRRDLSRNAFILFHLASDGRLVGASGIGPGNVVAKDIRLAEMLIARRARPDPALLAAPEFRLKSLLAA